MVSSMAEVCCASWGDVEAMVRALTLDVLARTLEVPLVLAPISQPFDLTLDYHYCWRHRDELLFTMEELRRIGKRQLIARSTTHTRRGAPAKTIAAGDADLAEASRTCRHGTEAPVFISINATKNHVLRSE